MNRLKSEKWDDLNHPTFYVGADYFKYLSISN